MNCEVCVLGPRKELWELAPAAAVRLEGPPEERVARKELVAVGLAVARPRPDLLAGADSPQRTFEEPREDHAEWRIQPDDRVGARPHQIAGPASAVVPVDDPGITFDGLSDALAKHLDRDHRPVRTPVQGVELDVRHAEPTR